MQQDAHESGHLIPCLKSVRLVFDGLDYGSFFKGAGDFFPPPFYFSCKAKTLVSILRNQQGETVLQWPNSEKTRVLVCLGEEKIFFVVGNRVEIMAASVVFPGFVLDELFACVTAAVFMARFQSVREHL